MTWDVFISHAYEDKALVARPLALRLREAGVGVWFDEFSMKVGANLLRRIDEGLAQCRFGIVIVSPRFFSKQWPRRELEGLVTRQLDGDQVLLLPIWHEVTADQVRTYSPSLANILALHTSAGIDAIVDDLLFVIRGETTDSTSAARADDLTPTASAMPSVEPTARYPARPLIDSSQNASSPPSLPRLSLGNLVRLAGTPTWAHEVYATPGDIVQWLLNTSNSGDVSLTDVVTRDVLPPHVQLDPGSVHLTDARGTTQLASRPLFGGGFNNGRYDPTSNTLITFKTTVLGDFAGYEIRVRNVGHSRSAQTPSEVTDDADVVIRKPRC